MATPLCLAGARVRPTRRRYTGHVGFFGPLLHTSHRLLSKADPHWNERPAEEQSEITARRQLDFLIKSAQPSDSAPHSGESSEPLDYESLWKDFSAAEFAPNTLSRIKEDMAERHIPAEYSPAELGFEEDRNSLTQDVIVNRINRRVATGGASDVSDALKRHRATAAKRGELAEKGVYQPAPDATINERLRRATLRRGYEGSAKEPLTPLAVQLLDQIDMSGPMHIAAFMHSCALDAADGFYATKIPFGPSGSFTTSPETTNLFAFAIARWVLLTYEMLGCPPRVDCLELGPGSGKLISDVLTHLRAMEGGRKLLDAATFHLIEASIGLRDKQQAALSDVTDTALVWYSTPDAVLQSPTRRPMIVYSNEFFDALPVRHFVNIGGPWSEVKIGINSDLQRPLHFGLTWNDKPSAIGRLFEGMFCQSHAPNAPAYRAMRKGSVVEWCPKGMLMFYELSSAIAERGGAMLAIDYGCKVFPRPQHPDNAYSCSNAEAGAPSLVTLRGIRDHQVVSFLSKPGATDVTADVNFDHLRMMLVTPHSEAATLAGSVVCSQPISQAEFLSRMGLESDLTSALRQTASRSQADAIVNAYEQLVGSNVNERGDWFKAMTVASKGLGGAPGFLAV